MKAHVFTGENKQYEFPKKLMFPIKEFNVHELKKKLENIEYR